MKNKILFLFLALLLLPYLSFADDYLYFGLNYSPTVSNGNVSHAIGGNFSVIGDYGGAKKVYSAIGFTADVTKRDSFLNDDLKKIGVNDFNSRFFAIPLRIGYPVFVKINEDVKFNFIPSLAFDIQLFNCNFKQNYLGYKFNYKISGWGYSLGFSANVGMQHKINKIYLRYGIDLDVPFVTMLLVNTEISGSIKSKTDGVSVTSIASVFTVTPSPYISVGFQIGK
ncbi:hypothetical protein HMPREF9727_02253 [Treponema denticola MYR-T]|uniref:Outer membrane protein beta-barrel domain-containing protein n=1 Tax=Treponema denticola H1-T TaxID=999431 RepID=M2AXT8_TREDN|nr:hypothetical protein [Treponema denticola]EMB27537.1 hypothetical protein HMPREF9727_02253 [Treponema denticola MYR-T]EMB28176.1 hypothetical protein HMPREF9725_02606 [Treponema denticola H1-T]